MTWLVLGVGVLIAAMLVRERRLYVAQCRFRREKLREAAWRDSQPMRERDAEEA